MYRNTCIFLKLCRISSKVISWVFSLVISSLFFKMNKKTLIIRAVRLIEEFIVFVRSRGKFQTPQSYVMLTLRIPVIISTFHKKIKLCSSTFLNSFPTDKLLSKHVTFANALPQLKSRCCGKTRNKNSKSVAHITLHCVLYYSSIRVFVCVFPTSI